MNIGNNNKKCAKVRDVVLKTTYIIHGIRLDFKRFFQVLLSGASFRRFAPYAARQERQGVLDFGPGCFSADPV